MKILTTQAIATEIKRCTPQKIAVAYLGSDWRSFIASPELLEYVILSPTFGTNPNAVSDLASAIGWEKIYFLDALHAKVFLGAKRAVTGSANLTRNGLSGEALTELCVSLSSPTSLLSLGKLTEQWRKSAQKQYPTTEAKKARLLKLTDLWSKALTQSVIKSDVKNHVQFRDFKLLGNDHFYVSWYEPGDYKYSPELEKIDDLIYDFMSFAANDVAKPNRWILGWKKTKNNIPHKTESPNWIFIHELFENGGVDEPNYPACAIQRTDWELPPVPFELTKQVKAAFRRAIVLPELSKYFIQDDTFTVKQSLEGLPKLLAAMRVELMAPQTQPAVRKPNGR